MKEIIYDYGATVLAVLTLGAAVFYTGSARSDDLYVETTASIISFEKDMQQEYGTKLIIGEEHFPVYGWAGFEKPTLRTKNQAIGDAKQFTFGLGVRERFGKRLHGFIEGGYSVNKFSANTNVIEEVNKTQFWQQHSYEGRYRPGEEMVYDVIPGTPGTPAIPAQPAIPATPDVTRCVRHCDGGDGLSLGGAGVSPVYETIPGTPAVPAVPGVAAVPGTPDTTVGRHAYRPWGTYETKYDYELSNAFIARIGVTYQVFEHVVVTAGYRYSVADEQWNMWDVGEGIPPKPSSASADLRGEGCGCWWQNDSTRDFSGWEIGIGVNF